MWSLLMYALGALLTVLLLAVLFALAYLVLPAYRTQLTFSRQGIPCAPFIPVIGHVRRLAGYFRDDRSLQFYHDAHERWGLIHAMSFGPFVRLTVDDPTYLADVLSASHAAKFHKPWLARLLLSGVVGTENLLLLEDEEHRAHRRMINPAFHHAALQDMQQLIVKEAEGHINRWLHSGAPQGEVDLGKTMAALTLSIIAACAFGQGFDSHAHATLHGAIESGIKINQRRLFSMIELTPGLRSLPLWGKVERDEGRRVMRSLVDHVVKERREGKSHSATEGKQDLLDLLLSATDEDTGKRFTNAEVRDEAMAFVMAGHETTSHLMTYALYVLAKRPSLWSDCLQEVLSVCGDSPPTPSDLSQLPVLDAVLHETLRFFSPVPLISRQVHSATSIGSSKQKRIELPVGALVQVHICIISRLKEYWGPTAGEFDHTRWLKAKKPYTHSYAFLPFGAGPRNCIGQSFALMEARIMLVSILQRCRIELVPGQKVDPDGWPIVMPAVTLRPKYPILVRILPRSTEERKEH